MCNFVRNGRTGIFKPIPGRLTGVRRVVGTIWSVGAGDPSSLPVRNANSGIPPRLTNPHSLWLRHAVLTGPEDSDPPRVGILHVLQFANAHNYVAQFQVKIEIPPIFLVL